MAAAVPARSEVRPEETWALEEVYASVAAWEKAFAAADGAIASLGQFRGRAGESAGTLLALLRAADEVTRVVEPVTLWAMLRQTEDATNSEYTALSDRARGLSARAAAAAAFIAPEIVAIPGETVAEWLAGSPDLARYGHLIARIQRERRHIRTAEVEQVMAQAGEVFAGFESVHEMLENGELPLGTITDAAGARVRLAPGTIGLYYHSPDRRVRREAWEQSGDAYLAYRNTFAASLAGAVKRDVFNARARGYGSSLEAALFTDNIPVSVFHNLVDAVWEHFPVWHRYFAARRKLLGLPPGELHGWDLEAPLSSRPPSATWEEGCRFILDSLAPLGEEYARAVGDGLASRWVDRCANTGKHGGAFSWGGYETAPYISMTWEGHLGSVSTLTHEIGHSMHTWLTNRSQPITYSGYGMSVAETASNFNQALLGAHLLEQNQERDWTLNVIEERMENHQRYLFIMPILAKFELLCHERVEAGQALGAAWMNETLLGFWREGYGGEVAIDPERMGVIWARFPHLYANFYVFQYGLGISAAAALAGPILAGDLEARERYLAMLRAGSSRDPIDVLRAAGVDMTTKEPIRAAFRLLEGYVARLEALAG
ncbi:MAG: oligoendopeptidase F [Chloroflexota bacterium]